MNEGLFLYSRMLPKDAFLFDLSTISACSVLWTPSVNNCSRFPLSRDVFSTLAWIRQPQFVVFRSPSESPQLGASDPSSCVWCTECQFGVFRLNVGQCRLYVYGCTWTWTLGDERGSRFMSEMIATPAKELAMWTLKPLLSCLVGLFCVSQLDQASKSSCCLETGFDSPRTSQGELSSVLIARSVRFVNAFQPGPSGTCPRSEFPDVDQEYLNCRRTHRAILSRLRNWRMEASDQAADSSCRDGGRKRRFERRRSTSHRPLHEFRLRLGRPV